MPRHISIESARVIRVRICTNPAIYNPAELWFTTTDGRKMRLVPDGILGMIDTEVFTRCAPTPGWKNFAMILAMATAFRTLPNYAIHH